MGMGPIPWNIIVQYANYYELDDDIAEAFVDIIRDMDNAFIKYQIDEQKRLSDAKKKPSPNRRK